MNFRPRTCQVAAALAAGVLLVPAPAAIRARKPEKKTVEQAPPPAPATPGHVTGIRFSSDGGFTRISVETSGGFKMRSDRLRNPDRLFFDLTNIRPAAPGKGMETIPVNDPRLKQIRVAETQPGTTRIVLDLESTVAVTANQSAGPDRLIIELRPTGTPVATGILPPKKQPAPEPAVETLVPPRDPAPVETVRVEPPRVETARTETARIETAKLEPPKIEPPRIVSAPKPVVENSPQPANRTASGDTSLVRALGLKLGKIVIDAGHGGHDQGTAGAAGLLEKDLVLDVSLRLKELIESRLNSQVILTRSDDSYVGLERRCQIANEAKADLFISVHANSSPVKNVSGVETYYLNFTTSKAALDVAARENASSEHSIAELKDLIAKIALRDKVDESREFAAKVQNALYAQSVKGNTSSYDRGVKKAPFVVLIGASMPAILAEIGFVTNPKDETLMKKAEYRQKIAEALYRGVSAYASGLSHFQVARKSEDN